MRSTKDDGLDIVLCSHPVTDRPHTRHPSSKPPHVEVKDVLEVVKQEVDPLRFGKLNEAFIRCAMKLSDRTDIVSSEEENQALSKMQQSLLAFRSKADRTVEHGVSAAKQAVNILKEGATTAEEAASWEATEAELDVIRFNNLAGTSMMDDLLSPHPEAKALSFDDELRHHIEDSAVAQLRRSLALHVAQQDTKWIGPNPIPWGSSFDPSSDRSTVEAHHHPISPESAPSVASDTSSHTMRFESDEEDEQCSKLTPPDGEFRELMSLLDHPEIGIDLNPRWAGGNVHLQPKAYCKTTEYGGPYTPSKRQLPKFLHSGELKVSDSRPAASLHGKPVSQRLRETLSRHQDTIEKAIVTQEGRFKDSLDAVQRGETRLSEQTFSDLANLASGLSMSKSYRHGFSAAAQGQWKSLRREWEAEMDELETERKIHQHTLDNASGEHDDAIQDSRRLLDVIRDITDPEYDANLSLAQIATCNETDDGEHSAKLWLDAETAENSYECHLTSSALKKTQLVSELERKWGSLRLSTPVNLLKDLTKGAGAATTTQASSAQYEAQDIEDSSDISEDEAEETIDASLSPNSDTHQRPMIVSSEMWGHGDSEVLSEEVQEAPVAWSPLLHSLTEILRPSSAPPPLTFDKLAQLDNE